MSGMQSNSTASTVMNSQSEDHTEIERDIGVEVEQDDPIIQKIENPFDPEKIKVRTTNILVEQIVLRIKHDEIDLAPDFQRDFVWEPKRQCRLIESLLLRIPIPVFYVAADTKDIWSVVDGVQRISTINEYMNDKFPLKQIEYLDKFDGLMYGNLPRSMQRRISETQLVVNVIEPGTPEDVMFNIFRRINTGGMTLKGQEIRNALHPGPVREYLKTLATTKEFLDATGRSISTKRMDDRECVLRFLAFYINPWEHYDAGDLDGHLSRAMTTINNMVPKKRNDVADAFKNAMRAAYRIFLNDAFRKRYDHADSRRPVSKALFEAWSIQLARCSSDQINWLVNRREEVIKRFISLMNQDSDFDRAISYSTGIPQRVKKRFDAIQTLVMEMLGC